MRKQTCILVAAAGLTLAACGDMMTGQAEMDPITRALAGNTISIGESVVNVNRDGTLDGTTPNGELRGAWAVRDGRWCRTITSPEANAGTQCQEVDLGEGEVTFTAANGQTSTWQIQ